MTDPLRTLQDIFTREIDRLNEASKTAPLDSADVRKLESLVKAYSNFRSQHVDPDDSLGDLTDEELLDLANGADSTSENEGEAG